mmetsp:Transcript_95161/g.254380  ORF Transcript_95161/g.254380 Transcript_95161/m.254380 type:complete len:300 (-) Transcript_95161:75-974(-)
MHCRNSAVGTSPLPSTSMSSHSTSRSLVSVIPTFFKAASNSARLHTESWLTSMVRNASMTEGYCATSLRRKSSRRRMGAQHSRAFKNSMRVRSPSPLTSIKSKRMRASENFVHSLEVFIILHHSFTLKLLSAFTSIRSNAACSDPKRFKIRLRKMLKLISCSFFFPPFWGAFTPALLAEEFARPRGADADAKAWGSSSRGSSWSRISWTDCSCGHRGVFTRSSRPTSTSDFPVRNTGADALFPSPAAASASLAAVAAARRARGDRSCLPRGDRIAPRNPRFPGRAGSSVVSSASRWRAW